MCDSNSTAQVDVINGSRPAADLRQLDKVTIVTQEIVLLPFLRGPQAYFVANALQCQFTVATIGRQLEGEPTLG